ncbi:MAG: SGNH/GDSL hydrolase family protein [Clostridia bacterium]|nr:SGNH/GDSL hydrolase family protein [Clostridia bacterium]
MKYDNRIFTSPVWSGNTVYNETVWPVDLDGEGDVRIPLLYRADKIISVTDTRLERVFEEGADYVLDGGDLVIKRGGNMSLTKKSEFFLDRIQEGSPFQIGCTEGGWLFFAEGDQITKKQYAVTYGHSDEWSGFIPQKTKKLPKTREKIIKKTPFGFAFFGDSITYGCNSSGMAEINVPPYAPIWPEMTVESLRMRGIDVSYINRAVGGMGSAWGAEKCGELFGRDKFDLFLIAFGMNDGVNTYFYDNTVKMIEAALKINPDCEFLLVSTMLPHKLAAGFYRDQPGQQAILEKICNEYGDKAELVPMTEVHKALLTKKRYYDMTGNNVNHPNDFLASVYAQTILEVLP